jgi:SAM-dependent methyltransferase
MHLTDIIHRVHPPVPWAEGEKIPWHDAEFSQRMLQEHLSQAHDAASRRFAIIDQQIEWIQRRLLHNQNVKILDLGCGPGLYTSRFARLGHECVGIDFSPASIAHARAHAETNRCTYIEQDIRTADYGAGFGLVMLIFGEFNVFKPTDAETLLRKSAAALNDGAVLLLEPHTVAAVRKIGTQPATWYSAHSGLFSAHPHLCLSESFWDEERAVATERYFILEASGAVQRYAASTQAYTHEEYQALLEKCGFRDVHFYPSLGESDIESDFFALTAVK